MAWAASGRLRVRKTKQERAAVVGICRVRGQAAGLSDDRVVTDRAKEHANEAFFRYYQNGSNPYDRQKTMAALAYFGLKACTKLEGQALAPVLERYESERTLDIAGFFNMIEDCRLALRSLLSSRGGSLSKAWKYFGSVDVGCITYPHLLQLLEDLRLGPPQNEDEREQVEDLMTALPWELKVGMTDVEDFVLRVREIRLRTHRQAERVLQDKYHIAGEVFEEFRGEIRELYEAFELAEVGCKKGFGIAEGVHLLSDFGCFYGAEERQEGMDVIEQAIGAGNEHLSTFESLLLVVQSWRMMQILRRRLDLTYVFRRFDVDGNNSIDSRDLLSLLALLQLNPRTVVQRERLKTLVEQADADGAGHFDVTEVEKLVQKVTECYQRVERQAENEFADSLGFTRPQVYKLRATYEMLGTDGQADIESEALYRAVKMLRPRIPTRWLSRTFEQLDENDTWGMSFAEFMKFIRVIEDDFDQSEGLGEGRGEENYDTLSYDEHGSQANSLGINAA